MATMSAEDVQVLIRAAVKGTLDGQNKSRREGGRLDGRFFRKAEKFDGKEGMCNQCIFQFKTQVGAANKFAGTSLMKSTRQGRIPTGRG